MLNTKPGISFIEHTENLFYGNYTNRLISYITIYHTGSFRDCLNSLPELNNQSTYDETVQYLCRQGYTLIYEHP